jgi:hypothetical protein
MRNRAFGFLHFSFQFNTFSMKKILLLIVALVVIGGAVGYFMWNKPHENMEKAKVDMAIDAARLFNDYNADENACNAKYLDKVIVVSGKVKESSKDAGSVKISLETGKDFGVVCTLDETVSHPRTDFPVGETVKLKGRCSGLNLDVQMDHCVEVK